MPESQSSLNRSSTFLAKCFTKTSFTSFRCSSVLSYANIINKCCCIGLKTVAFIIIYYYRFCKETNYFPKILIIDVFSKLHIDTHSISALLKVACIAIVSDFLCDILKDNNENALSRVIEILF